jgi:hypothetical protein
MIPTNELKPEVPKKRVIHFEMGFRGAGKTERILRYFRWYNCKKYRFAIAGMNWKDTRDL